MTGGLARHTGWLGCLFSSAGPNPPSPQAPSLTGQTLALHPTLRPPPSSLAAAAVLPPSSLPYNHAGGRKPPFVAPYHCRCAVHASFPTAPPSSSLGTAAACYSPPPPLLLVGRI
ncbi:hypothetical protein VPH35_104668 [Triticum aestivum]